MNHNSGDLQTEGQSGLMAANSVSHKQGQFILQKLGSFSVAKGETEGHNLLSFIAK